MKRIAPIMVSVVAAALALGAHADVPCDKRNNNTVEKLLECVTLEGVRWHQASFQAIADTNGGIRAAGTPGYDASAQYVATALAEAGYMVELQVFMIQVFIQLGPSTLEQTAPGIVPYAENADYNLLSQTDPGDVTGSVTVVDLDLGPGNASTSGCEASDFAGFPTGNIALIQRGACTLALKAENAAAAGAVGAVIFNQGNTPDRMGLINGTLGPSYAGGIPVFFATYDRGVEWDGTPGLTLHMIADVFRGDTTTSNVIAETVGGRDDNVVIAGAHLDSVKAGPGIQDNGSGAAALLEIALKMQKVNPRNQVRFAWWGAEESGLIGSTHYVNSLSSAELEDVALYHDVHMIASPNFARFVLDGDGSDTPLPGGPPGSGAIEALFTDFYLGQGLPSTASPIDGRSDYVPFAAAGIPIGGIYSGAEGIKTPEQVALYGGTAGEQYDPCYHLACDTFDNVSLQALDENTSAVAFAILTYAMSTQSVNGEKGRGGGNCQP